jgi:uncharacterized membrane protein
MRNVKSILYICFPLLSASIVGFIFGYFKYFDELKQGSDDVDAFRWAFIVGVFYSVIGLIIGLIINFVIWKSFTPDRKENE